MPTLPSPRHLLAILISSLSQDTATATANDPLRDATPITQRTFLTLHVLFPNELLPALDLLDRGLVTRFIISSPTGSTAGDGEKGRQTAVYYVRSAQPQQPNRHRATTNQTSSYEVRLTSWSCSCPAFAFAAFPPDPPSTSPSTADPTGLNLQEDGKATWSFGGLTLGTDTPVCKHLLACVLVEHAQMFRSFVEEREVSRDQLAGWAAGWGD